MDIGERIKNARKKKGWTQKRLEMETGINEANIRKYESGRQNPKIETLQKIATALDISPFELLDMQNPFSDMIETVNSFKKMADTLKKYDISEDFESFIMELGYHFMFRDGLYLVMGDNEAKISTEQLKMLVTAYNSAKSILVGMMDGLLKG